MKRLLLVFAGVMLVACSEQEPPPEPVREEKTTQNR